jgi:hypothetical protein
MRSKTSEESRKKKRRKNGRMRSKSKESKSSRDTKDRRKEEKEKTKKKRRRKDGNKKTLVTVLPDSKSTADEHLYIVYASPAAHDNYYPGDFAQLQSFKSRKTTSGPQPARNKFLRFSGYIQPTEQTTTVEDTTRSGPEDGKGVTPGLMLSTSYLPSTPGITVPKLYKQRFKPTLKPKKKKVEQKDKTPKSITSSTPVPYMNRPYSEVYATSIATGSTEKAATTPMPAVVETTLSVGAGATRNELETSQFIMKGFEQEKKKPSGFVKHVPSRRMGEVKEEKENEKEKEEESESERLQKEFGESLMKNVAAKKVEVKLDEEEEEESVKQDSFNTNSILFGDWKKLRKFSDKYTVDIEKVDLNALDGNHEDEQVTVLPDAPNPTSNDVVQRIKYSLLLRTTVPPQLPPSLPEGIAARIGYKLYQTDRFGGKATTEAAAQGNKFTYRLIDEAPHGPWPPPYQNGPLRTEERDNHRIDAYFTMPPTNAPTTRHHSSDNAVASSRFMY